MKARNMVCDVEVYTLGLWWNSDQTVLRSGSVQIKSIQLNWSIVLFLLWPAGELVCSVT